MSDFFERLAARTMGSVPLARPLVRPSTALAPDVTPPAQDDAAPATPPVRTADTRPAPPARAPHDVRPRAPRGGSPRPVESAAAPRHDAPAPVPRPAPAATPAPRPGEPPPPLLPARGPGAPPSLPPRAGGEPQRSAATAARVAAAVRPRAEAPANSGDEPRRESGVRVTIGRIEIRAVREPAPPRPSPAASTALSLDDYLARRGGESG